MRYLLLLLIIPITVFAECTLDWGEVELADSYSIYYGATPGTVVFMDTTANLTRTCSQMGITPTNGYTFSVEAVNTAGNSDKVYVTWRKPFTFLDYDYE